MFSAVLRLGGRDSQDPVTPRYFEMCSLGTGMFSYTAIVQ